MQFCCCCSSDDLVVVTDPNAEHGFTLVKQEDYEEDVKPILQDLDPSDVQAKKILLDEKDFTEDVKPILQETSDMQAKGLVPPSSATSLKVLTDSPVPLPIKVQEDTVKVRRSPPKVDVPRPPKPVDPNDPKRYPTPPPLKNLDGPSEVYPYVSYSCRPGGPRLFDILNEKPLDPKEFGFSSWMVVDREEQIFALPHLCDEDKVMQALWNRYIFVHR